MRLLDAYAALKKLNQPVVLTRDVAAYLDIDTKHANKILSRLQEAGQMMRLIPGKWAFPDRLDQLALPAFLTAPFPSYVSLQSALYFHAMVSQIPHVLYAVSPARTRRYKTPLGTVSVHHIQPAFFFGYTRSPSGVYMATPEKALVDLFYFFQSRNRMFRSLPELELPKKFNWRAVDGFVTRISSPRRRTLVREKLAALRSRSEN